MGSYQYKFTVFTPTYNRSHTLHRLFNSLMHQTYIDFEWLVVDDGSTDNTQEVLDQFNEISRFPIHVIRQEHCGVPSSINRCAREAKGLLCVLQAADDAYKAYALETINNYWESIPSGDRQFFSGVIGLCEDQYGNVVGDKFPQDVFDSNYLEIKHVYNIKGEKSYCCRTDVLRMYPFPDMSVASFIPESVIWTRIARTYKTRFINKVLRVYYMNEPDSITNQKKIVCPAGRAYAHLERLNEQFDYFRYAPRRFILSFIHYARFSFHSKVSICKMLSRLTGLWRRLITIMCIPIAYWFVIRDRLKGRV